METPKDKGKISLSIDGEKKIPVLDVANTIQNLQNIIYNLGDYYFENTCREGGDFPQDVKKYCTLLFTDIEMGSVHADLQISNEQTALGECGTIGERSIVATNEFLEALSKKDIPKEELYNIVNDPHRVNKLLREFYAMWPDENSKRTLSIGFQGNSQIQLKGFRKESIKKLLHKPIGDYEKEIFGWISGINIGQSKKITVESNQGKINCYFDPEIKDWVQEHLGKFVVLRGTMKPLHKGNFGLFIDSEDSIEQTCYYTLDNISYPDRIMELKNKIPIEFTLEDELFIGSNDELGLFAMNARMKDIFKELEEQLFILYQEYVLTDDELSKSGQLLREKLISIVGNSRGLI